jgi:hypothetical protein
VCDTGAVLLQKRIHEWSKTLPDWQRDLLRRLTEGPLTAEQQAEVLLILTGGKGAPRTSPLELDNLPADEDEHGPVQLTAISDSRNINLLAGGQTMRFSPGLNVVFGLTGAGKSGYGRFLRRLCRAAHHGDVLRNAFDPGASSAPQTARLDITVGAEAKEIAIDLAEDPARLLSQIAVFDAQCAAVYLSGPNTIDHVPRPLLLLRTLVETQDALAMRLTEDVEAWRAVPPVVQEIGTDTEASRRLAALDTRTEIADIERYVTLSQDEQEELQQLDVAVATIAADQSRQVEATARTRARAAQNALKTLDEARQRLDDAALDAIRQARSDLVDASTAERELTDKAFAGQRFPQTGQDAWREMWEAARRFVETSGGTFPDTGTEGACPTCQQTLDDAARMRMQTFEEFVRSDLSRRVATLRSVLITQTSAILTSAQRAVAS